MHTNKNTNTNTDTNTLVHTYTWVHVRHVVCYLACKIDPPTRPLTRRTTRGGGNYAPTCPGWSTDCLEKSYSTDPPPRPYPPSPLPPPRSTRRVVAAYPFLLFPKKREQTLRPLSPSSPCHSDSARRTESQGTSLTLALGPRPSRALVRRPTGQIF